MFHEQILKQYLENLLPVTGQLRWLRKLKVCRILPVIFCVLRIQVAYITSKHRLKAFLVSWSKLIATSSDRRVSPSKFSTANPMFIFAIAAWMSRFQQSILRKNYSSVLLGGAKANTDTDLSLDFWNYCKTI